MLLLMTLLSDEERTFVERVFKEHNRLFIGVAMRILGSQVEAEDAVSDAMIQIITNLDKISALPRHEMRSYCIVIVKNCAISRFRKHKDTISLEKIDQYIGSTDQSPDTDILRKERADDLKVLLGTLQEEERAFVELRFIHKTSYKDISLIFEISEVTARKRMERILKKLRDLINEELYYE